MGRRWGRTTHALFAEARTYYNTHIHPYINKATTPTATTTDLDDTKAFPIHQSDLRNFNNGRGRSRPQFNNSNNRGDYQHHNDNNSNRGNYNSNRGSFQRRQLLSDPNAWCSSCRRKGHSYPLCSPEMKLHLWNFTDCRRPTPYGTIGKLIHDVE